MTCVILDDEPHAIEVLKRYAEQTDMLDLLATFRNPVKALTFLQQEKIDLIFLDINMPGLNGIQFLKALPKKPLVIFTTAYSTYAVESYEWDAVDYLLKPVLLERFLKAVIKANEVLNNKSYQSVNDSVSSTEDEFILLKSGGQVHRVKLSDILYITKESNYLEVHTMDKKILIRGNMNEVFSIFPENLFCRIHKSHVVALSYIRMVESHQVEVNRTKLPLSASYRDDLMKRLGTV